MSNEKSELWRELKDAGYSPEKGFVYYTTDELREIRDSLLVDAHSKGVPHLPRGASTPESNPLSTPRGEDVWDKKKPEWASVPRSEERIDPNEMAGQRLNTQDDSMPLRIQPSTKRAIFQEEVRKPAFPKPRGRRILRQNDPGVKKMQSNDGTYTETFEVAGDRVGVVSEVKVTLPSYQVGIYLDPRFPFKVICYNGTEGFDMEDIENYFKGPELVPAGVKRMYVENRLCYNMQTVVRHIESEARRLRLI